MSCPFEAEARDPEALLARYPALVHWAEALIEAEAGGVTVVQRFHRAARLHRNGVDYQFVTDGGGPALPPRSLGVRMARAVSQARAQVVHVDGLVFPLVVRQLRMRLPGTTPIVVQDHGGIHAGSGGFTSWRWRMLHRLGLRAADGFMFTARELAAPWKNAGIIDGKQPIYEVLESSTSLASEARLGEDRSSRLPGRPSLLWVAKLDANKDPLTVLDAFQEIAAALPEAALTMVFGADDLLHRVTQRIAASPSLQTRVHLRGRLEHGALPPLYATADFFVLGSHHEGSGFALMEALSFGVTPVVTDIPAFRVLTDAGRLGALFPVADAHAMAAAVIDLARRGDVLSRRETVRAHFARAFSWSAVGRAAMASYRAAALRRVRRAH